MVDIWDGVFGFEVGFVYFMYSFVGVVIFGCFIGKLGDVSVWV